MSEPGAPRPQGRTSRSVTIKEVARLSGVSTATVTRALQGHPRVLPETRRRVKEAAARLGYRPDAIAQALVTGSSKTVGLVIPSSGDSFWGEIVAGIEEASVEAGFTLLFANSHGEAERESQMLELFLGKRVDGMIVAAAAGNPASWFPWGEPQLPVVLVSLDAPLRSAEFDLARTGPVAELIAESEALTPAARNFSHVSYDDVVAAETAVEYLLGLGHRRFGYLGGPPGRSSLQRLLGARGALEAAGLTLDHVATCDGSLVGGRVGALELLAAAARPTAILAYDDLVAIGAIRGARALGVGVPHDVSVVGFDDIEVAAFVEPALTTIRQPKREMGRLAMELLLDGLRGHKSPAHQTLEGELVVRESTSRAA
jgi:DNA-binding LacI/PurR family transcriptional regulator